MSEPYLPESLWNDSTLYFPLGTPVSPDDMRFYVAKDSSGEALLVVNNMKPIDVIEEISKIFEGLVIYQDNNDRNLIVCKLENEELIRKFTYVVYDIIAGASDYTGISLYNYLVKELRSWSGFLKPKRDGLSDEAYLGLWGELSVVDQYYRSIFPPSELVESWLGPEGEPQDIGGVDFTLEIKSTYKKTPKDIYISSLEQLDSNVDKQGLVLRRISKSDTGDSLNNFITRIEDYLSSDSDSLIRFRKNTSELIGKANVKQLFQGNIVNETICWDVVKDFPRLRRSEIDSSITKATYSIHISSIDRFIMKTTLEEFIQNG